MSNTKKGIISFITLFAFILVCCFMPIKYNSQNVFATENQNLIKTVTLKSNGSQNFMGSNQTYLTNDKFYLVFSRPTNGEYEGEQYHNFDSYGLVSGTIGITPTDWNLINGASVVGTEDSYNKDTSFVTQTTRTSMQMIPSTISGSYMAVLTSNDQTTQWISTNSDNTAARVCLQFDVKSLIELLKEEKGILGTVTLGETVFHTVTLSEYLYPQTIVSDETLLNNLNALDDSSKTGRLFVDSDSYSKQTGEFIAENAAIEYKYDNNYYVKTTQKANSAYYQYSNGEIIAEEGTTTWVKVEPIVWCVAPDDWTTFGEDLTNQNEEAEGELNCFSHYAIIAGLIEYANTSDDYAAAWANSFFRAYLNGYDLSKSQGDGGDNFKASVKANFEGYGFVDTIYHTKSVEVINLPELDEDDFEFTGEDFDILEYLSNLDSDNIIVVKDYENAEPGTYQIILKLKDTYSTTWPDGTTADKVLTYTVETIKITKPSLTQTVFAYTGNGVDINNYIEDFDENTTTKEGDLYATEIGDYRVTFSIKDTSQYAWADGTNGDLILSFTITSSAPSTNPEKPTLKTDNIEFTGQDFDITTYLKGFNEQIMDISGDTTITGPGNYKVTISLKDSQQTWADGTSEPIEIAFSVQSKSKNEAIITSIIIGIVLIAIAIPIVLGAIARHSKKKKDFL